MIRGSTEAVNKLHVGSIKGRLQDLSHSILAHFE